jgi:hypothetical protein
MKQEIHPAVLIGAVIAAVAAAALVFWWVTRPAGVNTPVPTKPNPPGGMPAPPQ